MSGSEVHGYRLKCLNCQRFFVICYSCFHGNRYGSEGCINAARFKSLKGAQRRYSKTPAAKHLQRRRQNRYRQRLKKR